jgi:hypothetical protein
LEEFKKNKAEAIVRHEERMKAVKAAQAAKKASLEKGMDGGKGKKRGRLESESGSGDESGGTLVGSMVEKDGVVWEAENGKVCHSCRRTHRLCLWREEKESGKRTKACLSCHENKKGCTMTSESVKVEVGLPKKKKGTVGKGKDKAEAEPVASGLGSGAGNVMEKILAELQGMRHELDVGFRKMRMELREIQRTGRGVAGNVADITNHFMPEEDEEEETEEAVKNADQTKN